MRPSEVVVLAVEDGINMFLAVIVPSCDAAHGNLVTFGRGIKPGLLDILRNTHFDNARQVIESLLAEVEQHRNGAEPNDDLTMMCIRVN